MSDQELFNLDDERFIKHLLDRQERNLPLRVYEHHRALALIDAGRLGMDGFKYCRVQEAKENRRKVLGV